MKVFQSHARNTALGASAIPFIMFLQVFQDVCKKYSLYSCDLFCCDPIDESISAVCRNTSCLQEYQLSAGNAALFQSLKVFQSSTRNTA
jgi:hypothetical protein